MRRADSGADRPGWSVRTIPNKFPTLAREAPLPSGPGGDEAHAARPGTGIHEVIIQNPRHGPGLPFLTAEHRRSIFGMFRQRVRALGEEPGVRSVLLFENAGPESGGTLYHPHAQVVALPLVPPNLEEELAGAERWTLSHDGACGWESVARAERALRTRLVWEDPTLVAFAPWAPQYPYEVLVMATHHSARFSESSDEEIDRLAEVVPAVLRAILKVEPRASVQLLPTHAPGDRTEPRLSLALPHRPPSRTTRWVRAGDRDPGESDGARRGRARSPVELGPVSTARSTVCTRPRHAVPSERTFGRTGCAIRPPVGA